MATITFQFYGFKEIHIPCNGDIRGTYFHSVCVRASDKHSPVVEQELLNPSTLTDQPNKFYNFFSFAINSSSSPLYLLSLISQSGIFFFATCGTSMQFGF